jgi:hypothetical protein
MRESEQDARRSVADEVAAARYPERELRLMNQLKDQQVEINRLRDRLRIADAALSGFGLVFVDRDFL